MVRDNWTSPDLLEPVLELTDVVPAVLAVAEEAAALPDLLVGFGLRHKGIVARSEPGRKWMSGDIKRRYGRV